MKLKLAHICILTNDLQKTLYFYEKVLGMTKVFDFVKAGDLYGYYIKMSDNNFIEVFKEETIGEKAGGTFQHLCLETDDIKESFKKIRSMGIETTEIKKGCDNTFQIWFKDPNGLDIELHQYTELSSQLTGKECEVDW
ncbi:MAG: VOC family protein [Deltaproteobacteria bacterium]|nr:VOC family protein [Deltaproteobacteria bacterium]